MGIENTKSFTTKYLIKEIEKEKKRERERESETILYYMETETLEFTRQIC